MALFKISTDSSAISSSKGSSFISKSGIYDVVINYASVDASSDKSSKAESVNFNLNYNGNDIVIYGPYITDRQGNGIESSMKLINQLGIIAGMGDGDDFVMESETHNVGKDNQPRDFNVITNFSDLPVKVRIQMEYSINEKTNEISERKVIKSFFNEDGATAEEIFNNVDHGKRLAWEAANVADNVTYKDGLTEIDITTWKESKKSGTPVKMSATPKVAPTAKSAGLFARK